MIFGSVFGGFSLMSNSNVVGAKRLAGQGQGTPCNKAEDREAKLLSICKSWRIDLDGNPAEERESLGKNRKPEVEANSFFLKKTHTSWPKKKNAYMGKTNSIQNLLFETSAWPKMAALPEGPACCWPSSLAVACELEGLACQGRDPGINPSCQTTKIWNSSMYTLLTFFFEGYPQHPSVHFLNFWNTLGLMVVLQPFMKQLKLHFSHFTAPTTWKIWQNFIANRN